MKLLAPILLAFALAAPLCAEVKLTTLPDRERVMVRFEDNGRVLVEEARTLTLDKGTTTVNFTWLGVNIDRGSIQLLGVNGVPFTVLRTTYPPDQGNSLSWEVTSANAGPAQVRISYLLDGLSREVALRAVITEGKSELSLRVFQRRMSARKSSGSSAPGSRGSATRPRATCSGWRSSRISFGGPSPAHWEAPTSRA